MKRTGLALALMLFATAASAAEPVPRVRMSWTETPPEIDGQLDDAVWQHATLIDRFVQVTPVQGAAPSQRTEVRLLTDREFLYVAVRCFDDDVDAIVANRLARDDFLFWDDRLLIAFDTFHDRQNGYIFEVNPVGARRDVLVEGQSFVFSWDTIWSAKTRIDEDGWSAEIRIPYQSLNYDPRGETWGLNISRGIRRNNEEMRWTDAVPQRNIGDLGNAGVLEGMSGLGTGIGLDVVPAVTVGYVNDGIEDREYTRTEPSGDVFYKVLPSLTASVTANTNFSETEADERRVNISRFAISFPEKRDFFLQDALIFEFAEFTDDFRQTPTNGQPFFSRRIGVAQPDPNEDVFESVDIQFGGKVTGRVADRFKVGLLHTLVDSFETIDEQHLTVGRVAMNVLGESTVGLIATHGDPEGRVDNTLVGGDFVYRNNSFRGDKTLTGAAWFQHSFTSDADDPALTDDPEFAFGAKLEYPNDIVNWKLSYAEIAADFNPALGFLNRADIREYDSSFRYRIRRPGYVRTQDAQIQGQLVTDRDNRIETGRVWLTPFRIENELAGRFEVNYRYRFERPLADFELPSSVIVQAGSYHFHEAMTKLTLSRNRPLSGEITVFGGEFYDGEHIGVLPEIEWRPSEHWLFEARYEFRQSWLSGGTSISHLARLRVGIFFTPDISWVTLTQWDTVRDTMDINSRLRWIIEDGREIFLVFNQGFDTQDDVERGRTEPLAKIAWTFRF